RPPRKIGVATNVTAEATRVAQVKAGRRRMVMPSVLRVTMVVNRLARARRNPKDMTPKLIIQRLVAGLARPTAATGAEVAIEPPLTGPTMKLATNMPPPARYNQKPVASIRGMAARP